MYIQWLELLIEVFIRDTFFHGWFFFFLFYAGHKFYMDSTRVMNKKKKRKKECERKNLPWTVFVSNSWSVYALFVLAGVVQSDSDCDKPGRCARLCCQNCLWGKLECPFLSDMCLSCKLDHSGYLLMEVTCPSSRKSPSQNLLHPVTRRCENWE